MAINTKQKGSLLPYFIVIIALCVVAGLAGNFLIEHFFPDQEWWVAGLIIAGPLVAFLVLGDLIDFLVDFVRKRIFKLRYFCPCCGFRSLIEKSKGSSELCEVCGWQQDYLQYLYKNREEGLNQTSFIECQQKFIKKFDGGDSETGIDRDPDWLASPIE